MRSNIDLMLLLFNISFNKQLSYFALKGNYFMYFMFYQS